MKLRLLPNILLASGIILSLSAVKIQAATFSLSPATDTFGTSCTQTVTVIADATGENSNAADLELDYNPTQITIIDSNPNVDGIQIEPGNAYEAYFANEVNETTGTIKVAAGSFISNLTSQKTFATVHFKANAGVTQTNFTINFSGAGATLDSNIADAATSTDLLTSVSNGVYTFNTSTDCADDTTAPTIQLTNPVPFGNSNGQPITFTIQDSGSGVDISSVVITLNGTQYTSTTSGITFTGSSNNYVFSIDPSNIPTGSTSVISITAKDLAGNQVSFNAPFNISADQNVCPATSSSSSGNTGNICSNPIIGPVVSTSTGLGVSVIFLVIIGIIIGFLFGKSRRKEKKVTSN